MSGPKKVKSAPLRDAFDRASSHFSGADAEPDDKVELWGRRIGRGLSLIACIVLMIMLYQQLRIR